MKAEAKLALKYAFLKRSSLVRFTTILSVIATACAVTVMISARAISNGFVREIQEKILANEAHISVFRKDGASMSNWRSLKEAIERNDEVRSVSSFVYENAIVASQETSTYCALQIEESESNKVSIGAELADKIKVKAGDKVEIFMFSGGDVQTFKITIDGTFKTGLYDYDSTLVRIPSNVFLSATDESEFKPTILKISVKDIYSSSRTARQIQDELGSDFRVLDWQEANQTLFGAFSLERKASLFVSLLIFFIACLNITTTLALLVNERRLDIAVLRTCGTKTKSLFLVFLFQGLMLSLVGIFFGLVASFLLCFLVNRLQIFSLPPEVYAISEIKLQPEVLDVILAVFVSFLLGILASVYPALSASRLKPMEILRRL